MIYAMRKTVVSLVYKFQPPGGCILIRAQTIYTFYVSQLWVQGAKVINVLFASEGYLSRTATVIHVYIFCIKGNIFAMDSPIFSTFLYVGYSMLFVCYI